MSEVNKTHYRKAFNSPYLSSADIVEPTVLTVKAVVLEPDKTKKTKDHFNTAYFEERFIREGEELKPMILNATNSRAMKTLTGSHFLEDWQSVPVTIYVDNQVRFGRETMEGLRISPQAPVRQKPYLTPDNIKPWNNAIAALNKYGDLKRVLERYQISQEHIAMLEEQAKAVS